MLRLHAIFALLVAGSPDAPPTAPPVRLVELEPRIPSYGPAAFGAGNLWVVAGSQGELWRFSSTGKSERFVVPDRQLLTEVLPRGGSVDVTTRAEILNLARCARQLRGRGAEGSSGKG